MIDYDDDNNQGNDQWLWFVLMIDNYGWWSQIHNNILILPDDIINLFKILVLQIAFQFANGIILKQYSKRCWNQFNSKSIILATNFNNTNFLLLLL